MPLARSRAHRAYRYSRPRIVGAYSSEFLGRPKTSVQFKMIMKYQGLRLFIYFNCRTAQADQLRNATTAEAEEAEYQEGPSASQLRAQ